MDRPMNNKKIKFLGYLLGICSMESASYALSSRIYDRCNKWSNRKSATVHGAL